MGDVQIDAVNQLTGCWAAIGDWDVKESSGVQSSDGFLHIHQDRTESRMKCAAFAMFLVQVVLRNYIVKHRKKLIGNGHTVVQLLLFECGKRAVLSKNEMKRSLVNLSVFCICAGSCRNCNYTEGGMSWS